MRTDRCKTVVAILFDGMNALDLVGPVEAFATVKLGDGRAAYRTRCLSLTGGPVRSESSLRLLADGRLDEADGADLLLIPGGCGIRAPETLKALGEWIASRQMDFGRVASICTGAYALAQSGVVDGTVLTTHWAFSADLRRRYPAVQVQADALFTRSDRFYSSGGVTAGIDLALELIEADFGTKAAAHAARELVVYLRRTGAQAQFSQPLRMQTPRRSDLSDVCLWAANNLDARLTVEVLAEKARLSPRQFSRRFSDDFGMPPASYIRVLRLDAARSALVVAGASIDNIARVAGFATADGFRRAFERRFGLNPTEYRSRFCESRH